MMIEFVMMMHLNDDIALKITRRRTNSGRVLRFLNIVLPPIAVRTCIGCDMGPGPTTEKARMEMV